MADLTEKLAIMLRQEQGVYRVDDYLNPKCHEPVEIDGLVEGGRDSKVEVCAPFPSIPFTASHSLVLVEEDWRSDIAAWSYEVADAFGYDREIVAVSISYLDRFLCVINVDEKLFQLASMTSLYLACKLYGDKKLGMASLLRLAGGLFTEDHMIKMEKGILTALNWQLHPPTPLTFAHHFILLLPKSVYSGEMMDGATFLVELSVMDYYFATKRSSSVGLAALLVSLEAWPKGFSKNCAPVNCTETFAQSVFGIAGFDCNSKEVHECYQRLHTMWRSYQQQGMLKDSVKEDDPRPASPFGVATLLGQDLASGHNYSAPLA